MNTIAVVGLGKAGLPLAAVAAGGGYRVIGIDIDASRCARINRKENPIPEETGLGDLLRDVVGTKLTATDSYTAFRSEIEAYIVIAPLFLNGTVPNFAHLDAVFETLRAVLKPNDLVVLETTVPPGTVRNRFKPILDQARVPYDLGYSPERIMTGHSISRYREFPKVVSGLTDSALDRVISLYSKFCSKVHSVSSVEAAELVKVCEGVYRDINIAIANEIYRVCQLKGLNYEEVRAAASHAYCQLLQPGIVGGHCIPVYPYFFLQEMESPLVSAARKTNEAFVTFTAESCLNRIRAQNLCVSDAAVLLLGVTYRDGVISTYNSPALMVAEKLRPLVGSLAAKDSLLSDVELSELKLTPWTPAFKPNVVIVFHADPAMKRWARDTLSGGIESRVVDVKSLIS